MAIFRNGQAVALARGVYPISQPGDPLRRVLETWETGLDALVLTSDTRKVLCEVLECEHVVIDFAGAGGRSRRRCRQCGGGRTDKAASIAGDTAREKGRQITTPRDARKMELERATPASMQRGYDAARRAAGAVRPKERHPSPKAPPGPGRRRPTARTASLQRPVTRDEKK